MKKNLKTTLLLALCCILAGWAGTSHATSFVFTDDFESYSLGALGGQGSWTGSGFNVVDTRAHGGAQSIYEGGNTARNHKQGTSVSSGTISTWIYIDSTNTCGQWCKTDILFYNHAGAYCDEADIVKDTGTFYAYWNASPPYSHDLPVSTDVWHLWSISWDGIGHWWEAIDGITSDIFDCHYGSPASIDKIDLETNNATGIKVWLDDFGNYVSPPSTISVSSPTNGSTITDASTNLVVNWDNIDHNVWDKLHIWFEDLSISESSGEYVGTLTANAGSFTLPLSDFNIAENGNWKLYTLLEDTADHQYYLDFDYPIYGLVFNVSGLSTPFTFENYDTWYSANVSNYSSPSDWAEAMMGFLNPIFEKIGEFSNRISEYLNVDTAYAQGLQIGTNINVSMSYVGEMNAFFGGYPIVQIFEWGILIFLGLFIVKIILKLLSFIPFVGGSG